jgi:SAM-dependent methyltransferase
MDAARLDFPDGEFDLVHSTAVFEHLEDVPAAVREAARVLAPTGVAVVVIHLFPSLSGGHHPEWAFPDEGIPRRVPPWDHLRGNLFPSGVPLNRGRERDFRAAFGERFEILEEDRFPEGEGILTPEIERELSGYARSELTTRAVRWALKRSPTEGGRSPTCRGTSTG